MSLDQKDKEGISLLAEVINIAGNVEYGVNVPMGWEWEIQAISIEITCSSTVANRNASIVVTIAGDLVYKSPESSNATASEHKIFVYGSNPTLTEQNVGQPLSGLTMLLHYLPKPLKMSNDNGHISGKITNGVASDVWTLRVIGRAKRVSLFTPPIVTA